MIPKTSAYLAILLGAALWGLIALFYKHLEAYGFSALQIVAIRVVFSAILLSLIILKISPTLLSVKLQDMWMFIGTGIISLLLFNIFYFNAISMSSISMAVLLLYTAPAFVMLLSLFFFKEKLTKRKLLALLVTLIGCICITGAISGDWQLTPLAFIYGIASGLGYALYSIFGKFALKKYNSFTISVYTFYLTSVGALPFCEPKQIVTVFYQNQNALWYGLGIAVFSTILPYLLYTYGLRYVEAGRASILATTEPVVGCLVGIFLFNETLNIEKLLGMCLILSAIVILNHKNTTAKS